MGTDFTETTSVQSVRLSPKCARGTQVSLSCFSCFSRTNKDHRPFLLCGFCALCAFCDKRPAPFGSGSAGLPIRGSLLRFKRSCFFLAAPRLCVSLMSGCRPRPGRVCQKSPVAKLSRPKKRPAPHPQSLRSFAVPHSPESPSDFVIFLN
jgi:hypothetical protein